MAIPHLRVLGLVFPGFNIMDLTGPMEVFGNSQIPAETRYTSIASATDLTRSSEGVTVKRDLSFIELLALQAEGEPEWSKYDVLVMPGAATVHLQAALRRDEGMLQILRHFASANPRLQQRWLFSVCTGAAFLGAAALLDGKSVTTHWAYLDTLREICTKAETKADIVKKRWVDVGKNDAGVRIVTAGGVSCGIDAALWIASQIYGMEKAMEIAKGMDYSWEYGGLEVTQGWQL